MAFLVPDIDPLQPFHPYFTHFIRNGMLSVAREAIHTRAY